MLGGLASAFLFAALIIIVAFIVFNDTSPVEIDKELREKVEMIGNDEEGSN